MKNKVKLLGVFVLLGLVLTVNAQHREKHSYYSKIDTEKVKKYHKTKEDVLIEKLEISKDKEPAFKEIFNKYDDEATAMIRDSREDKRGVELSDKEIKDRIYARFEVYQKLLNHRRQYIEKFLEVLTPKQLEKMFEMERHMGKIAIEKRHKINKK